MPFAKALRCRECAREYPLEPLHVCEFCFGPLEVSYDYDGDAPQRHPRDASSAARTPSGATPTSCPATPPMPSTSTPASRRSIRAKNLGEHLGLKNLYIKNDCVNPTWSFKDRVVTVAATKAREFGFATLACASTGNLANSVSAHAARAGLEAFVFIPADLERGKIVGSSVYGATLVAVDGNYDDVNRLCCELADKYQTHPATPLGLRQHQHAALLRRGQQDARLRGRRAARLARAGSRRRADGLRLALRARSGRACRSWRELWLIDSVQTKMSGAQARGCSPIVTALRGRHDEYPARPPEHHRQVARHRQPRRRLLRAQGHAGVRRPRRRRPTTKRSSPASSSSPRARASSPRRPAASSSPGSRSSRAKARSPPTS